MSDGPIPLWNRIRGVPNEPADSTTRPFGFNGMMPFGPSDVSFVRTPVMVEPLRMTWETSTYCLYVKFGRGLAVWKYVATGPPRSPPIKSNAL